MRFRKLFKFITFCINFFKLSLKVKIIFFFPSYHTGGAEKVHLNIVKSTPPKSSIVLFTSYSSNKHFLQEFEKHAYYFDIYTFLRSNFYKKILNILFKISNYFNQYTIFGSNSTYFYDILSELSVKTKKIDLIHAFSIPDKGGIEYYSLPYAQKLNVRITINKKTKNDFLDLYKAHDLNLNLMEKIKVIPNCVNIPSYSPKNLNDNLNIVYCGRIAKEKRVHLIVDIAEKSTQNNFSIYGHEEINIDGLDKYYKGNIISNEALNTIYRDANILLITSYREGFPMVIMEAMAHGVVCISTDVGGLSEHIVHGKNGFLISNFENEDEIVSHFIDLIQFLQNNPNIMQQCSLEAYKYAKSNFSIERFENNYKEILTP